MNHPIRFLVSVVLLGVISATFGVASPVLAQVPVVRAVLFYSPTCPHCHSVITEDLPPLVEEYAQQLQILGINTATPGGQALFESAIKEFNIPQNQRGVPMLIVGDIVLVGSLDIPEKFPGLIETYLSQGGVDWPEIPGLAEAMAAAENQENAAPEDKSPGSTPEGPTQSAIEGPAKESPLPLDAQTSPPTKPTATPSGSGLILSDDPPASVWARVSQDPAGNTLSILVLAGMLVSALWSIRLLQPGNRLTKMHQWSWMMPVLCIIGLGVAGYLSYIELTQSTAVCGPVGDCNTVQQSPYARLFGVLPTGILGLGGYIAILFAWSFGRINQGRLGNFASLWLLGMTFSGTLFSIYLTFLEPFVIGATCAWCLTSALIITALLWFSIAPAKAALASLNGR